MEQIPFAMFPRKRLFLLLSICLLPWAGVSAITEAEAEAKRRAVLERDALILRNQKKFEELPLKYDQRGVAVTYFVNPYKSGFADGEYRYLGFRFKTPEKIAGDFGWMYLLRNPDGPQTVAGFSWCLLRADGAKMGLLSEYYRRSVSEFSELKKNYPHTKQVVFQDFGGHEFEPSTEYVMWLRTKEAEGMPDLALAFAFGRSSELPGLRMLPIGKRIEREREPKPLTSYEGDPW